MEPEWHQTCLKPTQVGKLLTTYLTFVSLSLPDPPTGYHWCSCQVTPNVPWVPPGAPCSCGTSFGNLLSEIGVSRPEVPLDSLCAEPSRPLPSGPSQGKIASDQPLPHIHLQHWLLGHRSAQTSDGAHFCSLLFEQHRTHCCGSCFGTASCLWRPHCLLPAAPSAS